MIAPRISTLPRPSIILMKNECAAPTLQFLFEFKPNRNAQLDIQESGQAKKRPTQIIESIKCFKQNDQFLLDLHFENERSYIRFTFSNSNTVGPEQIEMMDGNCILRIIPEFYDMGLPRNEIDVIIKRMRAFGFNPNENFWSILAPVN